MDASVAARKCARDREAAGNARAYEVTTGQGEDLREMLVVGSSRHAEVRWMAPADEDHIVDTLSIGGSRVCRNTQFGRVSRRSRSEAWDNRR